jgi:hypothetical protein
MVRVPFQLLRRKVEQNKPYVIPTFYFCARQIFFCLFVCLTGGRREDHRGVNPSPRLAREGPLCLHHDSQPINVL